jgi:hypothetical protein
LGSNGAVGILDCAFGLDLELFEDLASSEAVASCKDAEDGVEVRFGLSLEMIGIVDVELEDFEVDFLPVARAIF